MGEAINLVNNFKVEKVIFNCDEFNDLESDLIKNENDNSNVIYTEINGYKFMFMGDASSTTEKEIMNKYNLPDIDVLKVGHHEVRQVQVLSL